jgi:aerobic-type carbon monoxide dehydrogenase small subunit (CoxS/CutS family)
MPAKMTIIANGRPRSVSGDPDKSLLYALRGELGLKGPKFGCGLNREPWERSRQYPP